MSVGQQITDIVGADSISWALATSVVPLLSSSVDGLYLQAMITSCCRLHIPLKVEQLTDTASKSVEKCISLSKYVCFSFEMFNPYNTSRRKFMPASQRVRVVVPADSNVVQVRRMSTSVCYLSSFYAKLVKCFSLLSFRSIELQQNRPPIRLRIRSPLPHSPQFSLFSFPLHLMHYQMLHSKILCRQLPQLMRLSCGINKLRV
jgi:hypothetical protein